LKPLFLFSVHLHDGRAAGVVSDAVLIAAPIYMLWGIRLPHRSKRLILVTFSMAVCNSFASLAHILHLLPPVTPSITLSAPITASIQTSVTLIVANLLVVVTFVNRVIFKRRSDDTEMSVHSLVIPETEAISETEAIPETEADVEAAIPTPS